MLFFILYFFSTVLIFSFHIFFTVNIGFKHFQKSIAGLENFIIDRNMNWTNASNPAKTRKIVRLSSNCMNDDNTTSIVVLSSFIQFELNLTIFLVLAGLLAFVQFMFLSMIKFSRPAIDF